MSLNSKHSVCCVCVSLCLCLSVCLCLCLCVCVPFLPSFFYHYEKSQWKTFLGEYFSVSLNKNRNIIIETMWLHVFYLRGPVISVRLDFQCAGWNVNYSRAATALLLINSEDTFSRGIVMVSLLTPSPYSVVCENGKLILECPCMKASVIAWARWRRWRNAEGEESCLEGGQTTCTQTHSCKHAHTHRRKHTHAHAHTHAHTDTCTPTYTTLPSLFPSTCELRAQEISCNVRFTNFITFCVCF